MNWELQMYKLDLDKAKEKGIKLSIFTGSQRKRISEKHQAFDFMDHDKLWEIRKEMGIPDHLTCLLKVKVKLLSRVRLFATPWTVAYQAPPSMGFSRQEYWSGVPLPSPPTVSNCSLISLPFSNLFTSKPSYNPSDHTSENTHLVTLSTLTFNILPLTIT